MSGDLIYRGSYDHEERRPLLARQARGMRAVQQRAELELAELVSVGRREEVKAMLRKRLVEDGMQDVADVGRLAQELANGDQWVASLLVPIVQEYARTTARDIRDFGRGRWS